MSSQTCADLIRSGRNPDLPIRLEVVPGSGNQAAVPLEITRIFRIMPGSRLVGLTTWEDEPALIKLFFQPGHWKRHLEREQRGNRLLMEARVSTPPLLETGTTADGKGALLLNRFLDQAESLGELSGRKQLSLIGPNRPLIEKVIALLSRCHEKGIWQQDIHLDNFMLHDGRIYFLDGADVNVETLGAALGEKGSLDNLAWFFAQFPISEDKDVPELYRYYCQCRAARQFATTPAQFMEMVYAARRLRLENYRKKLLRSTTSHTAIDNRNVFIVADRQLLGSDFRTFATNPDAFLERGQIIKAGNTCTVGLIELDGRQLILKRYNLKNFLHRIKRLFGSSRAEISWCSALLLQMLGIGTARPLAMIEQRSARIMRGKTYFLAELVNAVNVQDQLEKAPADPVLQEKLMNSFRQLFVAMQTYQFTHGDMKATNFIFADDILTVLDLDAMTWHKQRKNFIKAFVKDLHRFEKNWQGRPGMEHVADKAHNVVQEFLPSN